MENYTDVELELTNIKPFPEAKMQGSLLEKYSGLVTILSLGATLCVFFSTNKIVVGLSGTVAILLVSWSLYEINRSKNIDVKTKKSMRWVVLFLVAVIGKMVIILGSFKDQ